MKENPLPTQSSSLVKKHLTDSIFNALKNIATDSGFTLEKALQSGIKNSDSSIGIYAGDAQSYQIFNSILDPIIYDYHGVSESIVQKSDFSKVDLQPLDPEGKYIRSTRIRIARNLKGFNFTNNIALKDRRNLEEKIVESLQNLSGELKGEYYSHESLTETELIRLQEEKVLFKKGDRFQDAAGFNQDFPKCRGVFISSDQKFRVWLNEEDQMRIISQDNSADIPSVFNRLAVAVKSMEATLSFLKDDRYGYLTSCPTNIGTTMRAGVHIHLENLNLNRPLLNEITNKHNLQIRGTGGEKTEVANNIFDISNRRRLGITEVEIATNLHQGLQEIIAAEEKL